MFRANIISGRFFLGMTLAIARKLHWFGARWGGGWGGVKLCWWGQAWGVGLCYFWHVVVACVWLVCDPRCVEQPGSSCMDALPVVEALKGADYQTVRFWMGSFGAASPKPSKLFGSWRQIPFMESHLSRAEQKELSMASANKDIVRKKMVDGKVSVSRGPCVTACPKCVHLAWA